ncbi:thiolase family protein [Glaciecola petra]|uniref:Acetyl-CoA C-acyltransferase n=1 Tax=Glaciecola petra TaxID=3075602 RepID=A0ABU2ZPJ3_9ALTE|nr:acetyl-CoA C-acyltransferase [Aestuariibacter sp. P117]MDT0594191.1 acetyl-CoA C-acyltransferase [Aestuariibacter sp. P117]
MDETIVIVNAKRTPMGGFMGSLASVDAPSLGAYSIDACMQDINKSIVDEVIMGCVLPAGLGQAPARQAMLAAGLPVRTGAMTINKVCGSGMKAVMLAHDLIKAGSAEIVVAGGMENMSASPYLLPKARAGHRMGHSMMFDHMMRDGLENAYDAKAMGCFAQETADSEGIDRLSMDDFAIRSLSLAKSAIENGQFDDEITPVTVSSRKGEYIVDTDEGPGYANIDKIPSLRPAFTKSGTVTAANSSSISDGAAALLIMTKSKAEALKLTPLAKIVAHATHAMEPKDFTVAPVGAIEKVLAKANWTSEEVDLYEINEAFAMVTMLAIKKLSLDIAKVNINGGACALGHPIGASGARIIVTLLHALKRQGAHRGVASLCIGGGEATAIALERD